MGIEYETIENLFVFNQKDVIDIKLLFWNLKRNSIEKYIIDIIIENNIDVCIFAEYSGIKFDNVLLELKNNYGLFDGNGGCDKITMIARKCYTVDVRREQNRYTIYSVFSDNENYIIAGIHLQDNSHSDSETRKNTIRDIVADIKEQELSLKNDNTVIIGDFNASPFDDELVQKDSFNAVLFKDLIMKTEFVTFNSKKYRRFYNPMLNYISEDDSLYGSFYYSSGIKTLYWYFYDQVIVRKALANRIHNISIIKAIKNKRLVNEIMPNKEISDHLPLIVELERSMCND